VAGLLRPLCDAIAELLWLTPRTGASREEILPGAAPSTSLSSADNPLQLLRISLPASAGLYPEISGSHHRCNIRFSPGTACDAADTSRGGRAVHVSCAPEALSSNSMSPIRVKCPTCQRELDWEAPPFRPFLPASVAG